MSLIQKSHGLLLAFGLLMTGTALSSVNREWNVETSTTVTSLPESVPSIMFARMCATCASVELRVSKESRFFAGKDEVGLRELRELARKEHFMMVFYDADSRLVKRVVIHGVSASNRDKSAR